MKKRNLTFAIFAMAVATIVSAAFVSCKKDSEPKTSESKTSEMSASDSNMDEYLISFKKKLLSAQKGEETISLEQAQRDLGNLLNFDFGDANYATNVYRHDTLYAKIQLTSGQIDIAQLSIIYQTLFNQIKDTYHQIELPEKSVYSIGCSIENTTKNEELDIEIVLTTRAYDETLISNVNTDEGWRAKNYEGNCDGLYHIGAPEILLNLLRNTPIDYGCINGRVYITDITGSWISSDLYQVPEMADPNAPRGSRMFFMTDPFGIMNLAHTCLPYSEIMYYYDQILHLIYIVGDSFQSAVPNNHIVTEYVNILYQEYPNGNVAYWILGINHGKINCTHTQPET